MKILTVLICAVLSTCAPAFSQQSDSKSAKAGELLGLMNMNKQVELLFHQMKAMMDSQPAPANMSSEQKAKLEEKRGEVFDLMKARLSWDKMRPQYVKIYTDTFTESEIDGMLAFYKSPAGQSMLAKQPIVMTKAMELSQGIMKELMPQIQQLAKDSPHSASPK